VGRIWRCRSIPGFAANYKHFNVGASSARCCDRGPSQEQARPTWSPILPWAKAATLGDQGGKVPRVPRWVSCRLDSFSMDMPARRLAGQKTSAAPRPMAFGQLDATFDAACAIRPGQGKGPRRRESRPIPSRAFEAVEPRDRLADCGR